MLPRAAHAGEAQAQAQATPLIQDFKVAVYSAQPYVLDFLQAPLEQAVEKDNLRVGAVAGWVGFFRGKLIRCMAALHAFRPHRPPPTGPAL